VVGQGSRFSFSLPLAAASASLEQSVANRAVSRRQ
jgi:hypothetical protein